MRVFALPLVVHLSTLFGLLTIVTVAVLTWVGYQRTTELMENDGAQLAERAATEVRQAFSNIIEPVELGVALIGQHQVNEETKWYGRLDHLPVFAQALDSSRGVNAYYVGYRDGDFFMVRRLRSTMEHFLFDVGDNVHYIVQSIDREPGSVDGRFIYLDSNGDIVGQVVKPSYPDEFDPRLRPWYRKALVTIGVARTEPYIFATTHELGITFAISSSRADAVVGADYSLASVADLLSARKPTPSSRVVLATENGHVIAADDASSLVVSRLNGTLEMKSLGDFDSEPVRVFSGGGLKREGLRRFEVGDEAYLGWNFLVNLRGGSPHNLIITIPERELLAEAYETLRDMLMFSALVFVVALLLTLIAAFSMSRSLVNLTVAADRFRKFDYDTPLSNRSWIAEVRNLTEGFQSLQATLNRYSHLLDLISREKNLTSLQPTILSELSAVLQVDRAVLYVVPQQVDGLAPVAFKDGENIELLKVRKESADPVPDLVSRTLDAGQRRALTGTVVADEMGLPGLAAIDSNDTFPNALCYPLRDRKDDYIGAILFLDAENASHGAQALVGALTGIAAVSLETRQLIATEKMLFQAFIALIAGAIDAKSPYTGGHCERVPELTKMLAEAAEGAQEGPFKDFALSEDEWEAVHVAAWLHDCGKITSPEYVVDKATKLETIYDRIHEVRMRFEVLKRDAEIARLVAVMAGKDPAAAEAVRDETWRQLDEDFDFVAQCNEGGEFLSDDKIERLHEIAGRTWTRTLDDTIGISNDERKRKLSTPRPVLPAVESLLADRPDHIVRRPEREVLGEENEWGFKMKQPEHLYNRGELYNLAVRRGTLSDEERYKVNDHIIQTIIMLSALPYPRHLRNVPELAGGHHERIDGKGYPRNLTGDQMSPVARMMAIADIFEALTAADRPYKKGKSLSVAIKIMSGMADEGHVDPDLFNLFLTSGIYRAYAKRYMTKEQIDDVRIEDYLTSKAA
ncbi:HD domain-containing phosphohydrolase [Pelagibius marinus]|uniref:HD domain-containing phosphohydrolase n=1 Tax=Pelagibius marinus TaxID=2762760 RepID=UPI0018724B04|nr:HD domain-containing phosphohydrolase [Pelagibius marinus]